MTNPRRIEASMRFEEITIDPKSFGEFGEAEVYRVLDEIFSNDRKNGKPRKLAQKLFNQARFGQKRNFKESELQETFEFMKLIVLGFVLGDDIEKRFPLHYQRICGNQKLFLYFAKLIIENAQIPQ
jgi:hypothetical protein